MHLSIAVFAATLVTGSLVGCISPYDVLQTSSLSTESAANVVPVELRSSVILAKIREPVSVGKADAGTPGIYAAEYESGDILGYSGDDRSNGPPVCTVGPLTKPQDIAVDRSGDLIVPQGAADSIIVFAGPGLCSSQVGSIADPYGSPADVVASRSVEGSPPRGEKIVVANESGSVSVCTLSRGCTVNLTIPQAATLRGVALALNGDCWASGVTAASKALLVYFAHCRGHGAIATGFQNPYSGGLDVDNSGNLISFSPSYGTGRFESGHVYVYSGCNPACELASGPFRLVGASSYGHLDGRCKKLAVADVELHQIDVYSYSASRIAYRYSITNGLTSSNVVVGAAFSPRCQE